MANIPRILVASAAIASAITAFATTAEAKHHYGHHGHVNIAAAPALIPAHQKPGYVGIAAVPVPGLIDFGLGPIFPFGGWPK